VVGLLCDPGERYVEKYYSDAWLAGQGIDIGPYAKRLEDFLRTGRLGGPVSGAAD
jgi:cysteine synthase A